MSKNDLEPAIPKTYDFHLSDPDCFKDAANKIKSLLGRDK